MSAEFNLTQLLENLIAWCASYFWNLETAIQLVFLSLAFILGRIVYNSVRPNVIEAITNAQLSPHAKRIGLNLQRQIFPLTTLVLVFLAVQFASAEIIRADMSISIAVMKLLVAWIAIRVFLQFIAHNLVRNFFALSIWAIAALSIFGVLDDTTAALDAIGFSIGEFRVSIFAVLKGAFLLFLLLYFALFVSSVAEQQVMRARSLTRTSQVLISKIIRVALIVFAILIGITSAGIDLSLFAVFGGAIGLGIGFGLQKGISNLFSGMLLLMDKSVEPGDVIELENGTFGWINHMGARYTEVITRDNKSFLIPNEDFITQRVVNWSHGNTLIRVEVTFGVDYAHNPHEIIAMATQAAGKPERVVDEPKPICHLSEFGDSAMNFKLRFWIKDPEEGITNMRGEVMLALWDIFNEKGIKIPYPHREIIMRQE